MKKPVDAPERLLVLDSMRGIAALTVMVFHLTTPFQGGAALDAGVPADNWILNVMTFTPFHLLWEGHEAVYFFFVLSGFVLALPFLGDKEVSLAGYYTKRIFRIYPPYLVAVLVAVFASSIFYRGPMPQLSEYFNSLWRCAL